MRRPCIANGTGLSQGDATPMGGRFVTSTTFFKYNIHSTGFAIVLLIAAGLKVHELSARGSIQSVAGLPAVGAWGVIGLEWVIATWLLSRVGRLWARRAAIALLSIFLIISGRHLFAGHDDCGCFGSVELHPGWTVAFDLAAIGALWWFGRTMGQPASRPPSEVRPTRTSAKRAALAVCVSIPIGLTAPLVASHARAAVDGQSTSILILDPPTWKGKAFPLLPYLALGAPELSHGRWDVILVNHNCARCEDYLGRARTGSPPKLKVPFRVAVIDLAATSTDNQSSLLGSAITPMLRDNKEYVSDVPFEILLADGRVEEVRGPP